MRRTKIVCTIGPATESQEQLEQLMRAGMNVARLNFSHGTHQEHKRVIERVRALETPLVLFQKIAHASPLWRTPPPSMSLLNWRCGGECGPIV